MSRLLLVLLVLWTRPSPPGPALGDARAKELKDQILKLESDQPKDREVLQRAVDDYIKERDEFFKKLLEIVAESGTDRTNQEALWVDCVKQLRDKLRAIVEGAKGNLSKEPTVAVLAFYTVMLLDEDKCLAALQEVKVAEKRDEIVKNQALVVDMSTKLQIKWDRLLDEDNRIDEHEKRVVDELKAAIERSYDDADRKYRSIKEDAVVAVDKIVGLVKKFDKPITVLVSTLTGADLETVKQAVRAIKDLEPGIRTFSEIYLKTNENYIARRNDYNSLLGSERGGVYVLFGGFRRDTQEFVDKNGFSTAQESYSKAKDALDRLVSGLPTDGQKADIGAFAKEVLEKLSGHLSATEKIHNAFVERHKSKFFGPLGPDIKEALAETRVWEDRLRMIEGLGLESKLRQWRSSANTFFDVSLSGLSSADAEYLRKLIQERVDELVKSLEEAEKIPEKYRRDFDRREVESQLK
ncbi:MAG: hypothetical protein HYY17_10960 [Planctomycetes bacterium]|nr:hypothetical protein [Planctomycetota bacterium]